MSSVAGQGPEPSMEAATLSLSGRTQRGFTRLFLTNAPHIRTVLAAIAVSIGYFFAAKLGAALAFPSAPVSALWAPNAILLAALVLAPRERWWIYLLMVLPLHVLAQLPDTPPARIAIQYVMNCAEASLGAFALVEYAAQPRRFDRFRTMSILILFAAIIAPFATSVLVAAAFIAIDVTESFWLTVTARTITNTFAILTLVPLIVHAAASIRTRSHASLHRAAEACALAVSVIAVGALIFVMPAAEWRDSPVLLYAPLPLLLWAAVRCGVAGACLSMLALGAMATWGVLHGEGPFAAQAPVQSALLLVLFLVVTSIPLLLLAALLAERREATRALAASETKFRSIFENNIIPTVIWGPGGWITEINDAYRRLTGITRADLEAGLRCSTLDASNLYQRKGYSGLAAGSGRHMTPAEKEVELRDGRRIPVIVGGCRFPGDIDEGAMYAFDLSEARGAETARRAAESLHGAVLASLQDQIAVVSREGFIAEANDSWRRFVERSAVRPFERVLPGDNYLDSCREAAAHGDRVARELLENLRTVLEDSPARRQLEFSAPSADGTRWFEVSIEPLRRPEGGAVIMRMDVTQRKQTEIEVREKRLQVSHLGRAAVLGELSGAFAHELNQPLTSILGNAEAALQLLARGPADPQEIREILHDIVEDNVRASEVLQRLRALLRRGEIQKQPVDLNDVVHEVLGIAKSDLIARNVTAVTELDPHLPPSFADRIEIQQVVLNLVINGCEAMMGTDPQSRKLTLTTQYVHSAAAVELSVADCGCGITPANAERIFQPFVTTKKHGMGLGLAICRSIVEAHDGRIWAEGAPGGGAVLRFNVPVREAS